MSGVLIFADDARDGVGRATEVGDEILRRPPDAAFYNGEWRQFFQVAENFGFG